MHKSTPPDLNGKARLTRGYPAITATVVNTLIPVISYANWFPYKMPDFVSENREIQPATELECCFANCHHSLLAGHPTFSPPSFQDT